MLCPVKRPVTALDLIPLSVINFALVPRLGPEIKSRACLWVSPRPRQRATCWLTNQRPNLVCMYVSPRDPQVRNADKEKYPVFCRKWNPSHFAANIFFFFNLYVLYIFFNSKTSLNKNLKNFVFFVLLSSAASKTCARIFLQKFGYVALYSADIPTSPSEARQPPVIFGLHVGTNNRKM